MSMSTISGFINNAALCIALGLIYDVVFSKEPSQKVLNQILIGFILGLLGIGVMINAWELVPGLVFDTRSVLLSVTGLFFGVIPTITAILITGSYRLALGGIGVWMGVGVIITSGLTGLAWRHFQTRGLKNVSVFGLFLLGIITHIVMLLWVVTLPSSMILLTAKKIIMPVMLIFPFGTVLLGQLMLNRHKRISTIHALQENEEKYRQIFENAVEGFYQSKPDGHFISVNPAFIKMFGYTSAEELVSTKFHITKDFYVDPEVRNQWEEILQEKGIVKDYEFKAKRKNGSHFWASDSTRAVFNNNGELILYEGNVSDINERKEEESKRIEIEEELRNRNTFIEAIMDNLPIGLAVNHIDEGNAIYVNKNFESIYGWPKEELENVDDFFDKIYPNEEYRYQIKSKILADINSGDQERMHWEKIEITHKSGQKRIVTAKNIPLYEQNLMISTVQDITESASLHAQLQQAQKIEAIGSLAGGIAHDFNNLLSPIIGYAEIMMDEIPSESMLHEYTQSIYTAGKRASSLVQQILAFSRQSEREAMPVSIQHILKEVIKLCRSTIPSNIEIVDEIKDDCKPVLADATQVHQIAMNLITNAYHAVESTSGKICVQLKETHFIEENLPDNSMEPGGYAMLTVSDTGYGIDPSNLNNIFDPYFTTKEHGKGTGLGLSVVYGIVKGHGGEIKVHSEPGKGATFDVFFPLIKSYVEIVEPEKDESLKGGLERILLVDDEEPIARLETQILERLGYSVTSRTSSIEALEAFRAKPYAFDLVISDMTMPNMTGDHLSKEIIAINPNIPILICTGFSERLNKERAKTIGVKGFLMKPIIQSELAKLVREVLNGKKK